MISYKQRKFDFASPTMAASAPGFSPAFAAVLKEGVSTRIDASTQEGAFKALEHFLKNTEGDPLTPNVGPFLYTWVIPGELRSSPDRVAILSSIALALNKLNYQQSDSYVAVRNAGFFCFECSNPTHKCDSMCNGCTSLYTNAFLGYCHTFYLCSATKFS